MLDEHGIKEIDDCVNRVMLLHGLVQELRNAVFDGETSVEEAHRKLRTNGFDSDMAFKDDGTVNYPYLYGVAIGNLQIVQRRMKRTCK